MPGITAATTRTTTPKPQHEPVSNAYSIYGVRVRCAWPLDFPSAAPAHASIASVDLVHGCDADFAHDADASADPQSTFVCRAAPDGTTYVRSAGLYQLRVSADGGRVACRPLDASAAALFEDLVFGQALSCALVRQGIEQLHASVVEIGRAGAGFLGDCGFGKSSLAASFLQAGHRLLTDDLLVLDTQGDALVAFAGPGRIKLRNPAVVAPSERKRVFAVDDRLVRQEPLGLTHLFVLPPPDDEYDGPVEIRPLSNGELFQALITNTFNTGIQDRARLARLFAFAAHVAPRVSGSALRFRRGLSHVSAVRDAIAAHVARDFSPADAGLKSCATRVMRVPREE